MNNETAQDWVRQLVADLRVALSEGRTDRILALVGPFRFRGELAKWLGKGLEKDAERVPLVVEGGGSGGIVIS